MSLRSKQALILLIATVLPFGMGAVAVALVVAPAYRKAVATVSVEGSQRLADYVGWNLARNVSRLEKLAAWDDIRALAWSSAYLQQKNDEKGGTGSSGLPANPVAREFVWWRRSDPAVTELLATNQHGRVIAASDKPAAVEQAGQGWWQQAYAGGKGRVYVSDVSASGTGARSLSIAVPVYADASPGSRVIGVVKMALDVEQAFHEVQAARPGNAGEALLVNQRGEVLIDSGRAGRPIPQLSNEDFRRVRSGATGAFVRPADGDEALFAWAQVSPAVSEELQRARLPRFYILTRKSAAEAFGPLRMVHRWMLGIGLVTIAAAVALGYWLADVLVVRQVRTLARGMRELALGDFERAAAIAKRLTDRAR